ncbi:doublecortin domain-containing protein 2-like [Hippocampus zosterae]|uniref:doublecortin domain-containing protein 2-like n=1 Tax=Hippocampus zosterae TaxID=109293 RepID=UPI00223CE70C|nr:doublecortin domain-containing protein 2-like [Hippocampus zosterae]
MGSEKPSFLSQPVVKNIFMFRNGDPYFEARRVVINQRKVCNFETFLREVTGGIQAPFGAVRNVYTPRGGHKVDCLDNLRSGEQYVAAGRERFKKLDYLQIGLRKRRMLQSLPLQAKPLPPNRLSVSARFLEPIKEPCPIFVVANGDTMDPAIRLLIHQRMLNQFERILEMITEKMGLRVLGGVRSLYTHEGQQVTDGTQFESGQLYVAVGRERFKKLSYTDLLFSKPRGGRRVNGMKTGTLPPIYRSPKQNRNRKSVVRSTDSGDGESKASPLSINGSHRDHLSSIVREISQARLLSLRLKRSGQSIILCDNDDLDSKTDDGNAAVKSSDQSTEEDLASDDVKSPEGISKKAEEKQEASAKNTSEEDTPVIPDEKADKEKNSLTNGGAREANEAGKNENEGETTAVSGEQSEEVKEVKDGVIYDTKRASDEKRATAAESGEASGHSQEDVADESMETSAGVSDVAANVRKDALDENKDEISDKPKEKNADVSKVEMSNEGKDGVASNYRDEITDDVSDDRKNEGCTQERKDEAVDPVESKGEDAIEIKDKVGKERKQDAADKMPKENEDVDVDESKNEIANEHQDEDTDENKDVLTKGCREGIADQAPNESMSEIPYESEDATVQENKNKLLNETPDGIKSVMSSGHLNSINGDTKEGENEGNDTKDCVVNKDSGSDQKENEKQ